MSDIIIAGATYPSVPSILLPKAGGGFAEYTEEHTWMGRHPEFMSTVYTLSTTLDKTDFDDWTASTTATTILASANGTTFVADLSNYEYFLEWIWCVADAHVAGATMKAMPVRSYGVFYQVVHRRPYGLANFESETSSYNYCTALYTSSAYNVYYNTSGTKTWTTSMYGVYCTNTAGTLSSTSSLTPTVTPKSPAITTRCNSSYFATGRKAEIDSANTTIKVKGNVYRVDRDTSPLKNMYMNAIHLYNVPL